MQSGDSLWSIATRELGDGSRFKEIIDDNADTYPSLQTSYSLNAGWELKIGCESTEDSTSENTETSDADYQGGYAVNIKVTNKDKQPVEGAKVTIHSKVQETTIDANGVARFENVEPGDHRVLIAYQNFEGEQSLNLTGDVKEFNLNIVVEQKNILTSPLVMGIVSGLLAVIFALVVFIYKSRPRQK